MGGFEGGHPEFPIGGLENPPLPAQIFQRGHHGGPGHRGSISPNRLRLIEISPPPGHLDLIRLSLIRLGLIPLVRIHGTLG